MEIEDQEILELKQSLINKGWEDDEIERVVSVYEDNQRKDAKSFFSTIIYWIALLVTIVANFLVSALILFVIFASNKLNFTYSSLIVYAVVGVIGFAFGFVFMLLLKDLERMQGKHHVVISLFIPAMAFINVFVITSVSNTLQSSLNIVTLHPMGVSLVFVFFFSLTYFRELLKEEFVKKEMQKIKN
jgi:predicted membrane-bound spermidine synthase